MDLILRNLFCCQCYFLRIQMPVILSFLNTRDLYFKCAAHTKSNWWWRDLFQIVRSRENHKKGLEDNQGWKNPGLKKNNSHVFFVFSSLVWWFFWKETGFCSFFRKITKHYSELFLLLHATSPFSELRNNNFLYLLWHLNLRVKKCIPSFFSQCYWSIHSKVVRFGKHAHSRQRKGTPT